MVNRKDQFSIKNLVHFSLYRSIRDRKFNGTDKIPELISLRTTLSLTDWQVEKGGAVLAARNNSKDGWEITIGQN